MSEKTAPPKTKKIWSNLFLIVLVLILGYLIYDRFWRDNSSELENTDQIEIDNQVINQSDDSENINESNANNDTNQNVNSGPDESTIPEREDHENSNQNINVPVIDLSQYQPTVLGWNIYVSTKKLFSIEYPGGWYQKENPAGVYVDADNNLDKNPPVDVIKVTTYLNTGQLSLDEWIDTNRSQGGGKKSEEAMTLDGQPALYIKSNISFSVRGVKYNYYQESVFVGKGDKVYEINCLADDSSAPSLNDFRKIYPTFKILF